MPSTIVGTRSGGEIICSGNIFSGRFGPIGGIQLRLERFPPSPSGCVYIGLSGGVTITSGALFLSGGPLSGMLDGMQLGPGDTYFVPHSALQISGQVSIFATPDTLGSGARLFWEAL